MRALSVKQPWAWLIVNGHKDIENRDWRTGVRGETLIHASKGMTRREYEEAAEFALGLGVLVPEPDQLERGGIVGSANIVGCVDQSESQWFFGKYGFVLSGQKTLPFDPCKGALGFWDYKKESNHES